MWFLASSVVSTVVLGLHDSFPLYGIGDRLIWGRLLELADVLSPWALKHGLVEIRFGEELEPRFTEVRIGLMGQRVRAGEVDALAECGLERWVGGRLVSRDRPLRRPRERSG